MTNSVPEAPSPLLRAGADRSRCTRRFVGLLLRVVRSALILLLISPVLSVTPAVCQEYVVRFSFHRLAFETNSQEDCGHLLIIDNGSKGKSTFLASDGDRVYGFPSGGVESLMESWTGDTGRDFGGCWDVLSDHVLVDDPDRPRGSQKLSKALGLMAGADSQKWLTIFEALLSRARDYESDRSIRDGDVVIELDYEPAFSFTGWGLCDSLTNELTRLESLARRSAEGSVLYTIRDGPWRLSVGAALILYSVLMLLIVLSWKWGRSAPTKTDEEGHMDKVNPTDEDSGANEQAVTGGDSGATQVGENVDEKADEDGKPTSSEPEPSRWQRYLKRREERADRTQKLGELLDRTVRVLNRQHKLASYYYMVVRSVDEMIGVQLRHDEQINPALHDRLIEIKDEIDSNQRRPFSGLHETVNIVPVPDWSGSRFDKVSVGSNQKAEVTRRVNEHKLFQSGIPDAVVRDFVGQVFDLMHNLIWRGLYLTAGLDYWSSLHGKLRRDSPVSKSGENDQGNSGSVMRSGLYKAWDTRYPAWGLDDLNPQALDKVHQSYVDLRTGAKDSDEEVEQLRSQERGYRWFADSGWPLGVFQGITFGDFSGIKEPMQKALWKTVWDSGIGKGSAELVQDLQYAEIEQHLCDLDLRPATRDTIGEMCKNVFDGPKLAYLLNSALKVFVRSCLKDAAHIDSARIGIEGLKEKISLSLAVVLANSSVSLITPVLKSRAMIDLVWDLSRITFPDEKSTIFRALHPFRQSAIRATKKLERMLEFARLVPAEMALYAEAKVGYGVENYANNGRSIFLKSLWNRFGEEAFKEAYMTKGLHDNDYSHVVDIHEWGIYRDNDIFAECRPTVYTFGNNPINLGRIRPPVNREVEQAVPPDHATDGIKDTSRSVNKTHVTTAGIDEKISGTNKATTAAHQPRNETSVGPGQGDPQKPPDEYIDSSPTLSDEGSQAEPRGSDEQLARDDESESNRHPLRDDDSESKGGSFDDPT